MEKHERSHNDDKPFNCSDCEKKFATPSQLKTHERTHTNAKPPISEQKTSEQTFLDLLTTHTKRLEQRLDQMQEKMEKNNNIWSQNPALTQMWPQMHQIASPNLPIQTIQQRVV